MLIFEITQNVDSFPKTTIEPSGVIGKDGKPMSYNVIDDKGKTIARYDSESEARRDSAERNARAQDAIDKKNADDEAKRRKDDAKDDNEDKDKKPKKPGIRKRISQAIIKNIFSVKYYFLVPFIDFYQLALSVSKYGIWLEENECAYNSRDEEKRKAAHALYMDVVQDIETGITNFLIGAVAAGTAGRAVSALAATIPGIGWGASIVGIGFTTLAIYVLGRMAKDTEFKQSLALFIATNILSPTDIIKMFGIDDECRSLGVAIETTNESSLPSKSQTKTKLKKSVKNFLDSDPKMKQQIKKAVRKFKQAEA